MTAIDTGSSLETFTVADLLGHLGDIPPDRIHLRPAPGTAGERDVLETRRRTGRICELIDGTLVEKTVGYLESLLAMLIGTAMTNHVREHDLGIVLGEAGPLRILPGQVRIPDTCFIAWSRFPEGKLPQEPIPPVAPDLAVEVLSAGNTAAEMERKLRDYFAAGTRLVWTIDWPTRTARVYTAPDRCEVVGEDGQLDGRDVLPGFTLSLQSLFAELARAER